MIPDAFSGVGSLKCVSVHICVLLEVKKKKKKKDSLDRE